MQTTRWASAEHIRRRLIDYRAAFGWSQDRTAKEAGLGAATVKNIEARTNTHPREITVTRLAQAFGVTLEEFLGDAPPKGPRASRKAPSDAGTSVEARGAEARFAARIAGLLVEGARDALGDDATVEDLERVRSVYRPVLESGLLDPEPYKDADPDAFVRLHILTAKLRDEKTVRLEDLAESMLEEAEAVRRETA